MSDDNTIRQEAICRLSKNEALAVAKDNKQGSFIVANRTLQSGEILLECPSASLALDPLYRRSHCGYCANEIILLQRATANDDNNTCQKCHTIATCRNCNDNGVTNWHTQSGECQVLQCLVESFCQVFAAFEGMDISRAAQHIDSIYIITMRLAHRRQMDRENKDTPFPEIDWNLFDLLHSSPLPSAEGSSSIVASMASLLQMMNTKWTEKQTAQQQSTKKSPLFFDPQECVSIWNKCRGCCHAITDLSRPLGAQNLGMALFIPQSFYNHACAPNSFLSCLLPSVSQATTSTANPHDDDDDDKKMVSHQSEEDAAANQQHSCAVWSRVVCYCPEGGDTLAKGDPVTLSYIPLSGLCRAERQVRLQETYHFACDCSLCRDETVRGSVGFAIEQAVGGDLAASIATDNELIAALAPLRELQIDCYQKLTLASSMPETVEKRQNGDENEVEDEFTPRIDSIDQCIATLRMAQRGIRNQRIPDSHEVSLECHRLLAMAYRLLREQEGSKDEVEEEEGLSAIDHELDQHRQFFRAVSPAKRLLDPSALAIQHMLMSRCMESKLKDSKVDKDPDDENENKIQKERDFHASAALQMSKMALGGEHPFVSSLQLQLLTSEDIQPTNETASPSKKRKLA